MLHIQTSHPDGFPTTLQLDLVGKIDETNIEVIEKELDPIMKRSDKKYYIFDFSHLDYVNNEIVDYFLHFIKKEQQEDNVVVFVGLHGQLKDVFELFGIQNIAPIFEHSLAALQAIDKLKGNSEWD